MTDDRRRADKDHPQTIANEPDARGADLFKNAPRPHPVQNPELKEEASPIPAFAELGEVAEAARRHAVGAVTIGDAEHSGPGIDVGSGTPSDRAELGGGEPPVVTEDADPLGTYRPGTSRS